MQLPKRQFSMQVASENCLYLYLSKHHFVDKFFNQSQPLKHVLCEKLEMQDKFIKDLKVKKTTFT